MRPYTLESPRRAEIKRRKRQEAVDFLIACVMLILLALFFLAAAWAAEAMNMWAFLAVLGAAAVMGGVVFLVNVRERKLEMQEEMRRGGR